METLEFTNQDLTGRFGEESQFGDIIRVLEQELWSRGSIICEVSVNEKSLSEQQEKEMQARAATTIQGLKIVAQSQQELISKTIKSLIQAVPELKEKSTSLSSVLRENKLKDEVDHFIDVMEGCQWFSESFYLLRPLVFKEIENSDFQEKWNSTEKFFTMVAQEALNAFEKNDYILLSDIFEYDLTSGLDKWRVLLETSEDVQRLISS